MNARIGQPAPTPTPILNVSGGWTQKLHAALILVVPVCAAVYAAFQIYVGTVRTWQVMLALVSYAVVFTAITVGFHRLFTHRAFEAHPAVRVMLAIGGSMSAQGPPIYWVSNHRRHHQFCDAAGDPHSPHNDAGSTLSGWRGFLHAHIGWTFNHRLTNSGMYCKDLLRDRALCRINSTYYFWVLLGLAIPTAIGAFIERSVGGALNGLLWGGGVRLFLSYNFTNSINSITHSLGYRTFQTKEKSRNNPWLSLPTLGESWHNNHHANPHSAFFGYKWWEIDLGGYVVRLLEALGLAWNVIRPTRLAMNDLDQPIGTSADRTNNRRSN